MATIIPRLFGKISNYPALGASNSKTPAVFGYNLFLVIYRGGTDLNTPNSLHRDELENKEVIDQTFIYRADSPANKTGDGLYLWHRTEGECHVSYEENAFLGFKNPPILHKGKPFLCETPNQNDKRILIMLMRTRLTNGQIAHSDITGLKPIPIETTFSRGNY